MDTTHVYYLHSNGDLICKRWLPGIEADLRESDLVRAFWHCDITDRETAWLLLVESLAAGANKERVVELAAKWGCNDADAVIFAERIGCRVQVDSGPTDWYATLPSFVNLQESPSGWGATALDAMAELAKELGYRPAKMWGHTFKSLIAKGGTR